MLDNQDKDRRVDLPFPKIGITLPQLVFNRLVESALGLQLGSGNHLGRRSWTIEVVSQTGG